MSFLENKKDNTELGNITGQHNTKMDRCKINTQTTGFTSPAENYANKRLDLNDLIVKDFVSTFYFSYDGDDFFDIKKGNVLVVDKSVDPKTDSYVLLIDSNGDINLSKYSGEGNVWGTITWVLNKVIDD